MTDVLALYASDQDLTHPYVSPFFGSIGQNWPDLVNEWHAGHAAAYAPCVA